MNDAIVKQETNEPVESSKVNQTPGVLKRSPVIDVSSGGSSMSDSFDSEDSDVSDDTFIRKLTGKRLSASNGDEGGALKKPKLEDWGVVLPLGFLDPLPPEDFSSLVVSETIVANIAQSSMVVQSCKQFWKAGDYEGGHGGDSTSYCVGMDHVRVHPKFLHSNATSHKWALGAFAELLDNSLDENGNGATYVNVDMLKNKKGETRMLLVEDNGGGMNPDKMRQCMSLGYSEKSKFANTIGQYGNGFKTSTMRLGADVIVFSRCQGKDGRSPTQSIGLMSYTFLRSTGKEDIVVPMVDYEKRGQDWNKFMRSSPNDWNRNLKTIVQWSPYISEEDLIQQFDFLKDQGTRIIIYNLWEDDQGKLELDFDTDAHDIQIRGVNRDQRKIEMAQKYPNSRHFLTYRHSLRSYASILYLRLPPGFQITLRGKDVNHHNLVNDMMLTQKITYRPMPVADGMPKDPNMFADVTIGFAKDAEDHIDIQGFNVYHKNRLIKPFWRVWNAAGSDGRGVIGVLEANFVEPAHDKQGFERTTVLSRLEARLVVMQKNYWSTNCHKIGYAPRRHSKKSDSPDTESSPSGKDKSSSPSSQNGHVHSNGGSRKKSTKKSVKKSPPAEKTSEDEMNTIHQETRVNGSSHKASPSYCGAQQDRMSSGRTNQIARRSHSKGAESNGDEPVSANSGTECLIKLQEENRQLRERLQETKGPMVVDLLNDLQYERDRCKSIEIKFREAKQKLEESDKEQEALINIFSEERNRRDEEEENLRKKLKDASNTIGELLDKVRLLENRKALTCKTER